MMKLFFGPLLMLLAVLPLRAADSGASVVVVYNARMPESKQVAEYYAQRRQVPAAQVFGFDLPQTEGMTRAEYLNQLQTPLLQKLETNRLFVFQTIEKQRRVVEAKVRYAALCYGVPTKILRDTNLVELGVERLPPEFRRNEASVDSQLVCLPMIDLKLPWAGPLRNPVFTVTNDAPLHPTNGVWLVTRLDGPSAAIARGLVDKAIEAETNGLWGRAYFDARGLTNGSYHAGDEWIREAADLTRSLGFETELDNKPETFTASFPMSQIAFYAGWYDGEVSGPFTRPKVEFMPGAFAYHLHSFSAVNLRSATRNWAGPLLAKGATATMGCVDEPYLQGTPNIAVFFWRFVYSGFSFGEAAWASQGSVSWQTIAVGDPLYRPFARRADQLHADLEARGSPLTEWAYLRGVNMQLTAGRAPEEMINLLEQVPVTRRSAVLKEKLAELYWAQKRLSDSLDSYEQALKLNPSPQQKIRITLALAQRRAFYGPDEAAFALYENLLQEFPDYPDQLTIYRRLLSLAQKLEKKEAAERCEREIKRLTSRPKS